MTHSSTSLLFATLLLSVAWSTWGQTQTVGTFVNTEEAWPGYTLLDPMGTGNTYLIDACGQVVQSWSSEYNSGGACYLLDDGSLLRGCRINGAFAGGGTGGRLEQRSWEGDLVWSLDFANDSMHHHHDVAWMPNGHVLVLAWESRSAQEAAAAGRVNPQLMWPESITEIQPTLPAGGEVVWEWHAWDHLVQNTDATLDHFGEPSDHPELLDVNHAAVGGGGGPGGANSGDWMHANAVNYNADLDQIAVSSRRFNEVWILDHNTTTEEAQGAQGDLLYRFGNPAAYGLGDEDDQVLFGQHDVQWVPAGHPDAGSLVVYNNGDGRPGCNCSSIDVWSPPVNGEGTYEWTAGMPFGPESLDWSYPEVQTPTFFSPNISGVQPLPNGNYLICEGAEGHLFEVTQEGSVVWDYINPEGNFGPVPQGSNPNQNSVFRAYRYGMDHPALEGKELVPGDPVQGPDDLDCILLGDTGTSAIFPIAAAGLAPSLAPFPNPARNMVQWESPSNGTWSLVNAQGQSVMTGTSTTGSMEFLEVGHLPRGFWTLVFQPENHTWQRTASRLILAPH